MKRSKLIIFLIFISFISCDNWDKDSYPIVGNRFKIIQDGCHDAMLIRTNNNIILVKGHILFYGSNSDFIITDEKPRDSVSGRYLELYESNNKFDKSYFIQYWIITLKDDNAFGPYQKAEYLVMRNRLGVPNSLKLNCSTKCFYLKGQRNDVCYEHPDSDVVDIKNLKGNKYAKIFFN